MKHNIIKLGQLVVITGNYFFYYFCYDFCCSEKGVWEERMEQRIRE